MAALRARGPLSRGWSRTGLLCGRIPEALGAEHFQAPSLVNAPFLRETPDGTYISVKLQPRASKNQIGAVQGNEIKISVTAPPVDSAANEAVIRFLAEELNCSRSSIQLVRGQTSRHKLFFVAGPTAAAIAAKLLR